MQIVERRRQNPQLLALALQDEIQRRLIRSDVPRAHHRLELGPAAGRQREKGAQNPQLGGPHHDQAGIEILPPRQRDIREQRLEGDDAVENPAGIDGLDGGEAAGVLQEVRRVPADHGVGIDDGDHRVLAALADDVLWRQPALKGRRHQRMIAAAQRPIEDQELDAVAIAPPLPGGPAESRMVEVVSPDAIPVELPRNQRHRDDLAAHRGYEASNS